MDQVTFQSNQLERLLTRFDRITEKLCYGDLSENERTDLQVRQMSLVTDEIPQSRAKLRLEMERAGMLGKAHAAVPCLEMHGSDESGWTCTFQTYMVEDDMFWNNSEVKGTGASPKDARSDFWVAWRNLSKRRHGRNIELREVGRVAYQQMVKAAQDKVAKEDNNEVEAV